MTERIVSALHFALLSALLSASPAIAQMAVPQLTRDQLARPVVVTQEGSLAKMRGRIRSLDGEWLTIVVNGQPVDVPMVSVSRIDVAPDSLANGAFIGAIVLGLWCAKICGQGVDSQDQAGFARVMGFGIGALIGAGIDARTGRRPPIYVRAPGGSAHVGFSVRF